MARLPTALDLSGPENMRSGRVIASYDVSAIGRGLANMGADISVAAKQVQDQQNTVDIARAEAEKTKGLLDVQNKFANDPGYDTYNKRAPVQTGEVVKNAGNLIRDPRMRERWLIGAGTDALRLNDGINDHGVTMQREAETVAFDNALETNRRIYVDPATPDAVRAKARADIEGAIQAGKASGLLDPSSADARRKTYLDQADVNRGLLAVELHPELVRPNGSAIGYGNPRLPAGMRNNNPGNIKYVGQGQAPGVVGPSANTDQGDPQAVFATPEAGMRAAYDLAVRKYEGGKTTANDLIAGEGGWTPGNKDAAANVAASMGIKPTDDLNLKNPDNAKKFLRALVTQEHGPASQAYTDNMITNAVSGKVDAGTAAPSAVDLPIIFGDTTGRVSAIPDMAGVHPEVIGRFKSLQNAFGSSIPVVSGYRDPARNERAGGAKASQHLDGNALDLDVSKMSQEDRIRLIQTARAQGFGGIGVYGNSIHVDTGPVRAWGASHHSDSLPAWARDAVNTPVGAGAPAQDMPDWYKRLSPEDQFRIQKRAETVQNQQAVEQKGYLDVAVTNAPAAILNTGTYSGQVPSADQFFQAYGPQEGASRYNNFIASTQTSKQAYDMRTMSAGDIQTMVNAAKPTSSGDNAALETARYQTLSQAAETTLKAREADPATYVRNAFPAVNEQWSNAASQGNYQGAVAASIAAQEQIGIKNVQPLPKEIATNAVSVFKDENQQQANRIGAVSSIIMATNDPVQRGKLFEQMVSEGLPDLTQGAFEALSRGDQGAANRLFQAAMTDPTKLAGQAKDGQKPVDIDQAVQTTLMDQGQIGDIYYGLSNGTAENYTRAQRDSKLINNAVNLRLRNGETMDAAIAGVSKDLYGDVKVINDTNMQILVPKDQDPAVVQAGLTAQLPAVQQAVEKALALPGEGNDPVSAAARQYPIIKSLGVQSVTTPMPGDGRMLEFWPPGEPGDSQYPRPKELALDKPGVQIISPDAKPSDVAADIVSHYMVNTDPKMKEMYQQFADTFKTPDGQARLKQDYEWSKKNEGETRSFSDWASTTRVPDYFRGYLFKQWPEKSYSQAYTQEQRDLLDKMGSYIQAGNGEASSQNAILGAVTSNYTKDLLANGYFRNSGDGYVFIDPKTALAVADQNGQPIIFKPDLKPVASAATLDRNPPANIGIRDAVMGQ
jgi:hypothetical protein